MPLPVSKVALWNPGTKKGDRVGIKRLADGKKVRVLQIQRRSASTPDNGYGHRHGKVTRVLSREGRSAAARRSGLSNRMEVPRIIKITLNMGVGEAVADRK